MCFFKLPYSIKKQLATTHASRRKKPHSTIRLAHHLSRSHLRTRSTGTCHRFFLAAHLTEKLKKYHVSCMQSFFILNWVVGFNGTNHFHLACTILHQRKILYPDRRLFPCAHYEILIHFKAAIVLMHFLCTAHLWLLSSWYVQGSNHVCALFLPHTCDSFYHDAFQGSNHDCAHFCTTHLWLLSSWYVSRQQSRLCTFMYHTPVTPFIMVSWYVQVSNHVCALFCTTHLWLLLSWYVSRQQSWLCTFVYHTPVTPFIMLRFKAAIMIVHFCVPHTCDSFAYDTLQGSNHDCALLCTTHLWLLCSLMHWVWPRRWIQRLVSRSWVLLAHPSLFCSHHFVSVNCCTRSFCLLTLICAAPAGQILSGFHLAKLFILFLFCAMHRQTCKRIG